MIKINACGLSCPQPVMLTMDALKDHPEGCIVLVDNKTALENVTRYAKKAGYNVSFEEDKDTGDLILTINK